MGAVLSPSAPLPPLLRASSDRAVVVPRAAYESLVLAWPPGGAALGHRKSAGMLARGLPGRCAAACTTQGW